MSTSTDRLDMLICEKLDLHLRIKIYLTFRLFELRRENLSREMKLIFIATRVRIRNNRFIAIRSSRKFYKTVHFFFQLINWTWDVLEYDDMLFFSCKCLMCVQIKWICYKSGKAVMLHYWSTNRWFNYDKKNYKSLIFFNEITAVVYFTIIAMCLRVIS